MSSRYGYFVLQVHSEGQGSELRVSGVLEDLATGEKRRFERDEELTRLLRNWTQARCAFIGAAR